MRYLYYLLIPALFSGCFPNFAPEKTLVKKIERQTETIEWSRYIGVLDQNFPDLVILSHNNNNDTICRGFNIADVNIIDNDIIICFYGTPDVRNSKFHQIGKYELIVDTTFVRKSNVLN